MSSSDGRGNTGLGPTMPITPVSETRLAASRATLERERVDAQRDANRMARVQAAGSALAEAATPDEIAAVLVQHGRAALGARQALLALVDRDGQGITIVRAIGFERGAFEEWKRVALTASTPLTDAARRHLPVYMETVRRDRSEGPELVAMLRATGARACVAIPIVASGAVTAVLGLFFAVPRPFSAYERELIEMIAQQGGPALDRARRQEIERRAHALAEAEKRRSSFLADASAEMTSTLDGARTLESVVRIAVPYLADACAIDLRGDDGSIARAAIAHADPAREAWFRDVLSARPIDPGGPHPIAVVARTGRATLVNRADPAEGAQPWTTTDEAEWDLLAQPIVSAMIVPLVVGQKILGTLMFASESPSRVYRPVDLALAESLAHRAALAIENAQLYQAAQRAIRSRDEVLAIVSHDLRNPLGVIKTLVGGLRRSLPDESANERVLSACEAIRRSTDRMNRLIDDLLDVAGIEAGKLSIRPAPHDLVALIDEAVSAILPLAAAKELKLETDVAPRLRASCDRARILQVLANLLGNAIKFTPERGGAICVRAAQDGDVVRVSVVDRGPGIAPEDVGHVFDRYWQAKSASRGGAGLGLAIVKGIVEAHGGHVHVESLVCHGASFVFTLPVAPAVTDAPGRGSIAPRGRT